jgi:hypothetical protein
MFINIIVFMDFPMLRTEGVFEMDDCDVQEQEANQWKDGHHYWRNLRCVLPN